MSWSSTLQKSKQWRLVLSFMYYPYIQCTRQSSPERVIQQKQKVSTTYLVLSHYFTFSSFDKSLSSDQWVSSNISNLLTVHVLDLSKSCPAKLDASSNCKTFVWIFGDLHKLILSTRHKINMYLVNFSCVVVNSAWSSMPFNLCFIQLSVRPKYIRKYGGKIHHHYFSNKNVHLWSLLFSQKV